MIQRDFRSLDNFIAKFNPIAAAVQVPFTLPSASFCACCHQARASMHAPCDFVAYVVHKSNEMHLGICDVLVLSAGTMVLPCLGLITMPKCLLQSQVQALLELFPPILTAFECCWWGCKETESRHESAGKCGSSRIQLTLCCLRQHAMLLRTLLQGLFLLAGCGHRPGPVPAGLAAMTHGSSTGAGATYVCHCAVPQGRVNMWEHALYWQVSSLHADDWSPSKMHIVKLVRIWRSKLP